MKIEAGKFYKTRDGRKVGPMRHGEFYNSYWPFKAASHPEMFFKDDGFSCPGHAHNHRDADDLVAEWVDEMTRKFRVGDVVNNSYANRTVVELITEYGDPAVRYDSGGWDYESSLTLVSRAEPAPTEIKLKLSIDVTDAPKVGDDVLIKGWITSVNHSAKGTHYGIAFETVNRRVSLHFLEEDFILDEPSDPVDADNDNGPPPIVPNTAAAFDALCSGIVGLTYARAA